MKMMVLMFVGFFLFNSFARDYEIFDGRNYNGKYYPKIDIIVWRYDKSEDYTLQFQVYWKGHPVEMAYEFDDSTGQKVMKVQYIIKERDNEVLCRRVPAPGNFGPVFKAYKETGDKDMDNTILSMVDLPKKGNFGDRVLITPPKYDAKKCPSEEGETNQNPFAAEPTKTPAPAEEKKATESISKPQTQEELNKQFQMFQ